MKCLLLYCVSCSSCISSVVGIQMLLRRGSQAIMKKYRGAELVPFAPRRTAPVGSFREKVSCRETVVQNATMDSNMFLISSLQFSCV